MREKKTYSNTMFVFALVKKLAQNMGTSYSGFGKTAKSKTCKNYKKKISNLNRKKEICSITLENQLIN